MAKQITIQLSDVEYAELNRIAEASFWSLEKVVEQCVRYGLPPTLNFVPAEFHDELLALNKMSDKDLLEISEGSNKVKGKMDDLHKKADFPALRRTYALSLLRWRGHPIPTTPYESLI